MSDIIDKVVFFNQDVLGIDQRTPGPMSGTEHSITISCLHEEVAEYADAYNQHLAAADQDKVMERVADMADAFIDNIYFGIGALYKLGLTADQIRRAIDAVHDCNVTKKAGKNAKRNTGAADAIKPENWIGPEEKILGIIRERVV